MDAETGNLLAPLLGVAPGSVTMHQNATVAQSIVASCFSFDGPRRRIILQDLDFPTNHYLFEGFRRYGAQIDYIKSASSIRAPIDALVDAIDDRTALVPLSLVLFRSGCLQDVRPVVEKAHRVGAHVVLDVYQAAGTVPMQLAELGVDFAVGGSVKWLCGGPGAGYLYVRPGPRRSPAAFGGRLGRARRAIRVRDRRDQVRGRDRAVPERHAERSGTRIGARRL